MSDSEVYSNPLTARYASRRMAELWSDSQRFVRWRSLWIALAEIEKELGLDISAAQIAELKAAETTIDLDAAAEYEKRFRHDVMAHVHAYGDDAPSARGVIHLGATSCYVTDNADLIAMRTGLQWLIDGAVRVMRPLAAFAREHRSLPTLGFTHFQPAQLTTVGKRACLWLFELKLDYDELVRRRDELKLRGAKGTTGTQASFLALFDNDHEKVRRLDAAVAQKFNFPACYPVTGQTYSRKIDSQIMNALGGLAQSAAKFAADLRLLAHRKEIEEPFESEQIGSSAMPYKRNPMRCERMNGLARFLSGLPAIAAETASHQWFERTLDDSACRRLMLPQAFLAADAVLRLWANVVSGLVVYPSMIDRAVRAELPFMASENLMMAAVRLGGDRQQLHEAIRRHSLAAGDRVKNLGQDNDLIDRLRADPAFSGVDFVEVLDPRAYVGRAPEQVDEFLASDIDPLLAGHATSDEDSSIDV